MASITASATSACQTAARAQVVQKSVRIGKPSPVAQLNKAAMRVSRRQNVSHVTKAAAAADADTIADFDPKAEVSKLPFTYDDFEKLLEKYDFNYKVGDKVTGTVFKIDNRGAYVDVGAKSSAFVPNGECSVVAIDSASDALAIGERREFIITRDDDPEGGLTVSLKRAEFAAAWQRVRQLQAEDVTINGKIVAVNRGGVLCEIENLRGFVPSSHLTSRAPREDLLGQTLPFKFLEVDEERTRLVMSNRRAMADRQLQAFKVGDVVVGTVQAVKPYGAFVDIGGVNGLLHISQISHDRIANLETVLSVGDELKVMILSQDRDRGRISLSTKKLEPTPGDMLRDPALVYEKADEMAATFRERVAAAEAAARAEEQRLAEESSEEAAAPAEEEA